MKLHIFIIALIPLFSCSDSKSTCQKEDLVDVSLNKELLYQIQEQSDLYLSKDTSDFQEKILIDNKNEIILINDSIRIVSIPIEGNPIRKDYILYVISDKKLFSATRINGNWIDNNELEFEENFRFLSKPLIYLEDVSNDGTPELIIKDRMHNGNLFNAASMHIFSLNNMMIKYIGAFEYISYLPIENEFMVRYWNTQLNTVNVYLKKELYSNDSIKVGTYKMSIKENTLYYYDVKISLQDFEDLEHLIPSLGMQEY
jgi:hypothetical protein